LMYLPALERGSVAKMAVLLGVVIPPAYSLYWLTELSPPSTKPYIEVPASGWMRESTYALDCRRVAGAHLGDRPKVTYVDAMQHYVFTSCRPIFGAGVAGRWPLKTEPLFDSIPQLTELHTKMLDPGADLDAVCAAGPNALKDAVCTYAVEHAGDRCVPEG